MEPPEGVRSCRVKYTVVVRDVYLVNAAFLGFVVLRVLAALDLTLSQIKLQEIGEIFNA